MSFENGHAVIIGVETYKNDPSLTIPIAGTEAKQITEIISAPQFGGYRSDQVTFLTRSAATHANTIASLEALADTTGPEATIFLYFVGHGVNGKDGYWYFMCHDTVLENGQADPETGLSEVALIRQLRRLPTQRLFLCMNACFSGRISPILAPLSESISGLSAPPPNLTYGLLGTGRGRIILTASRADQPSYFSPGQSSTHFGQAFISALKGDGVASRGGYISAFRLYEYVYDEVSRSVNEAFNEVQQPELTVLKGTGSFAIANHRGGRTDGKFTDHDPLPATGKEISPSLSDRLLKSYFNVDQSEGSAPAVSNQTAKTGKVDRSFIAGNVTQNSVQIKNGDYYAGPVNIQIGDSDKSSIIVKQIHQLMSTINRLSLDPDILASIEHDLFTIQRLLQKPEPVYTLIERKLNSVVETLKDEGLNRLAADVLRLKNACQS